MDISSSCLSCDENKWFRDDELVDGISGNFEVIDASKSPTIDVEDNDSPFQLLDDPTHSDDVDIDSECPLQFLSEFETPENRDISETKAPPQKKEKKRMRKKEKKMMEVDEVEGLAEDIQDEDDEMKKIRTRFKQGCDCEDSNCFQYLDPRSVYKHRLNITELTKAEHDMYLMGLIKACISCNQTTKNKERQRLRAHYFYQGRKVCLTAFLFLENCTRYQLKAMRCHLMSHGVTPRVHGNQGKRPHNVFSLETYNQASEFLKKFFEQTSAGSGYGRTPLTISLDHTTRKHIHALYTKQYTSSINDRLMGYSTFLYFMKHQFPHVKFVKQDSLSKIGKELSSRDKISRQSSQGAEHSSCTMIQVPSSNNEETVIDTNQYRLIVPSSQILNANEMTDSVETYEMLNSQMIENDEILESEVIESQVLDSQIIESHVVDSHIIESQVIDGQIIDQPLVETSTQPMLNSENNLLETQTTENNQLVFSINSIDKQCNPNSASANPTYIMTPTYTLTNQPLLYIIQ